jgi:adenylosuccinate lyase
MTPAAAGADRQEMHERLREHSLRAWDALQAGDDNPLVEMVAADDALHQFLDEEAIRAAMQAGDYVGDAPVRARNFAAKIRENI